MRARVYRLLAWLLPLLLGAVLAAWLAGTGTPPVRTEAAAAPPRAVRVVAAEALAVRPRATGFGIAAPAQEWRAIAEVAGEIVYRHPGADSGVLLEAGTRLFGIDPADYELALAEARAERAALAAERRQLDIEAENLQASLAIERERLALAERELERVRALGERGSVSAAAVDTQALATLQQRQAVRSLENEQRTLPARRERLDAELERARSRIARAERDLRRTLITAPMDLRVTEVAAERHQYVGAGEVLLSAEGIAAAEVTAQIPVAGFRRIVGTVLREGAPETANLAERVDLGGITAELRLVSGGGADWTGRVTRIASGLDPRTRTAQVVVTVDEPYRRAQPPERPPLVRNMYVAVTLTGRPLPPMPAIPAAAVHQGEVYVVTEGDRLERRPVEVAFRQGALAAIRTGLAAGERVVVDDLAPAVDGMPLAPQPDAELARRIAAEAGGGRP